MFAPITYDQCASHQLEWRVPGTSNTSPSHNCPTRGWSFGCSLHIMHLVLQSLLCSELVDDCLGCNVHDDVIKWKHFPRHLPFVRGTYQSLVYCHKKCQWRGALMFSLIYAWKNGWANNRDADDLRSHCADYDVTVMLELQQVKSLPLQGINK